MNKPSTILKRIDSTARRASALAERADYLDSEFMPNKAHELRIEFHKLVGRIEGLAFQLTLAPCRTPKACEREDGCRVHDMTLEPCRKSVAL